MKARIGKLALQIVEDDPDLCAGGWRRFEGGPCYLREPAFTASRAELLKSLNEQVTDALVFLAAWPGRRGEAEKLARAASKRMGRKVTAGAMIVAARIAGGFVLPGTSINYPLGARLMFGVTYDQGTHRDYLRPWEWA